MICGIDEAGRGPLAGPVYAAAVILDNDFPVGFLNDSKKMTSSLRGKAREIIIEKAFAWGVGSASHTEIDKINILQASLLAMKRAFEDMLEKYRKTISLYDNITVIADGNYTPVINIDNKLINIKECKAVVKADAQIPEVMAASIIAKTSRDSYMEKMALLYPQYGYEKHKGYPVKAHREAVHRFGPSPIQRLSFKVTSG